MPILWPSSINVHAMDEILYRNRTGRMRSSSLGLGTELRIKKIFPNGNKYVGGVHCLKHGRYGLVCVHEC